jgi:DNA-binding transcriptional MerR regulator
VFCNPFYFLNVDVSIDIGCFRRLKPPCLCETSLRWLGSAHEAGLNNGEGDFQSPNYFPKTLDLELTLSGKLTCRGEPMKIAEVSESYAISADTLRYYERIGLLPTVNRNPGGIRDYNDLDVRRVGFIKCMRSAGLPIDVLIEYMELVQQGDTTIEARKEILVTQREHLAARMAEMQETLDLLDYKISVYENALLKREQELVLIEE